MKQPGQPKYIADLLKDAEFRHLFTLAEKRYKLTGTLDGICNPGTLKNDVAERKRHQDKRDNMTQSEFENMLTTVEETHYPGANKLINTYWKVLEDNAALVAGITTHGEAFDALRKYYSSHTRSKCAFWLAVWGLYSHLITISVAKGWMEQYRQEQKMEDSESLFEFGKFKT